MIPSAAKDEKHCSTDSEIKNFKGHDHKLTIIWRGDRLSAEFQVKANISWCDSEIKGLLSTSLPPTSTPPHTSSSLSFTDVYFSTTSVPTVYLNIQTQSKCISYTDHLTQICHVLFFLQAFFKSFLLLESLMITMWPSAPTGVYGHHEAPLLCPDSTLPVI